MQRKLLMGAAAMAAFSALAADRGHDHREYGRKNDGNNAQGEDAGNLGREIRGLKADLLRRDEEIRTVVKAANDEAAASKTLSEETKGKLDDMLTKASEMQARLVDLEQKAQALVSNDNARRFESFGARALKSDDFVAMLAKNGSWTGRCRFEQKATITSATTDEDGSAGALIVPTRLPGIIADPDRPLTIRNLIMPGRTGSNAVEFVRETGFTNNAAMVAEGGAKPQSGIQFEEDSVTVRTLAHWVLASKQVLADAPMLQSYIDGRLRYGLGYVEEGQILLGDGTGQNLHGIIPQATDFDSSRSESTDTYIDTLRRAATQVRLAEYRASGYVLNPADWETIELTKDENGGYIFANPQNLVGPRLWGLPVVDTQAIPQGAFLTGAFMMGAQVFDREQTVVEVSTEDSDNFRKNLVTIRAEERLALAVFRPEAFVHGFFEGPTGTD